MGALRQLDRAFGVVRHVGAPLLGRAWLGGGLVAAAVVAAYYLEAIEGARVLRGLTAGALLVAWGGRALLLTSAARRAVVAVFGDALEVEAPRPADVLGTAAAVLAGLWLWLWIPLGALWVGPAVLPFLPLLALRGASAPGWIARAAVCRGGGLSALARAFADARGHRLEGIATEALLLAGIVLLAANLFGVFAVGVLVGRSFLGLDVAQVEAFLSPENGFVVLVVFCASGVALEPVRVACAVLAHGDARARREGFELRALVDRAVEVRRRAARGAAAPTVLAFACLVLPASTTFADGGAAGSPPAEAPSAPSDGDDAPVGVYAPSAEDVEVQREVERILERPEFRQIADSRSRSLHDLVTQFVHWLADRFELPDLEAEPGEAPRPWHLPGADAFLFAGLFLTIGVLGYLLVTRAAARRADASSEADAGPTRDPRDRSPGAHLDHAGRLAAEGRYRDALRALYLATLVSLDRRRLITFDPTRTNWQYMRQMAPGPMRERFGRFTRLFDHKWYGDEPTAEDDYARGRALADAICGPEGDTEESG